MEEGGEEDVDEDEAPFLLLPPAPVVAWRSLLEVSLTIRCLCWLESAGLLAGEGEAAAGRGEEASPLESAGRREREDIVRSLSLSAKSVIAMVARWAAERRGREDMAKICMTRQAA